MHILDFQSSVLTKNAIFASATAMTAAHCLNGGGGQPVDLYFNLLNRNNLNDPLARKRTSAQIIIHENYNGSTEEVSDI